MNNYIIDVSEHNGVIDLSKAKPFISGIVARCSYGWQTNNIDKQWDNNASQADKLGIPLFAYHFCYARNEDEAKKEAYCAINACEKYNVKGIFYDMEDSDFQGEFTSDEYYQIAKAFCDTVEKSNYYVGIYSNQNWFENKLTHEGFSAWILWLANYGINNGYNNWNNELMFNPFNHVYLHQFTSNAKAGVLNNIQGINSKGLDCSYNHGLLEMFSSVADNNGSFNIGSRVKVKENSTWYDGSSIPSYVFLQDYEVIEIVNDRVVIGVDGIVTGAISIDNIY